MLVQIVAPSGEIIYANSRWRQTLGYSEHDLQDLSLFELIPEEEKGAVRALLQSAPKDGQADASLTLKAKNGRLVRLQGTFSWQREGNRVACVHGFLQEIAEAASSPALPEPAARLVLEATSDVIVTTDTEGIITSLTPSFETTTGTLRSHAIQKPLSQLVSPEDKVLLTDAFFRLLKGASFSPLEIHVVGNGGAAIPVEVTFRAVHDSGRLIGAVIRMRDRREIQHLQALLAESETRFRKLFDSCFEGIVIHRDGKILDVNPYFVAVVNAKASPIGQPIASYLPSPALGAGELAHRGSLVTGSGKNITVEFLTSEIPYQGARALITIIHPISISGLG